MKMNLTNSQDQWSKKAAKKLKYAQSKEVDHIDLEELDKFDKIQCEEHANRLKVLEVQQKLSFEKIKQAKLAHLAAKEQEEAAEKQRDAKKKNWRLEYLTHTIACC